MDVKIWIMVICGDGLVRFYYRSFVWCVMQNNLKGFVENWVKRLFFYACLQLGFLAGVREQVKLDIWVGRAALSHSCKLDGSIESNLKLTFLVLNSDENFSCYFVIPPGPPAD